MSPSATIDRLAQDCGSAGAAVALAAFLGKHGGKIYIPAIVSGDHLLAKIIGKRAFAELCRTRGGETVAVPLLDLAGLRTAGRIYHLSTKNLSRQEIAYAVGVTPQRVGQVLADFREDGVAKLFEEFLTEQEDGDDENE